MDDSSTRMSYPEVYQEVVEALQEEREADGGPAAYDIDAIISCTYLKTGDGWYHPFGSKETFWAMVDDCKMKEAEK